MAFVLDASVTIAWCYEDESSSAIDSILQDLTQDHAIVPTLWQYEVTNVLWLGLRKGRIEMAGAQAFLRRLGSFNIVARAVPTPEILELAASCSITAYDASYLWLARHDGLPLATLDSRLRRAAIQEGIVLLP